MLSKTSEGDVLSAQNRLVDCDVCLTWQPPLNGTVIGQFHLATDHYRCLHTGVLSHSSCQYTLVLIASSETNAPGVTFVFFCFGAQTSFKLRASLFPLLSSQSQSQFGWVVSCSSQWLITHAFTILLNYRFLIADFTSFQNLKLFLLLLLFWNPLNTLVLQPFHRCFPWCSFQHNFPLLLNSVMFPLPRALIWQSFSHSQELYYLLSVINASSCNQAPWLLLNSSTASKAEIVQPRGESRAH